MIHQVLARLASYGVIHGSRQHSYPLCLATASRPSKYAEYLRSMPWSITLYVKLVLSAHASVPEVNINVYKISYVRAPRLSSRRAPSSFRVCTVISTRTLELLRRYPEHIYTRPYALPTTTLRYVRRSTMVQ